MTTSESIEILSRVTEAILCPPFEWCHVPGGAVTLEDGSNTGGTKGGEYQVADFAIPDYQAVAGNISVHILERAEGDVTHFITLTFWESMDVIKGFAGDDVEVAKYYPEDQDFLIEFEPTVVHYEVVRRS